MAPLCFPVLVFSEQLRLEHKWRQEGVQVSGRLLWEAGWPYHR